MLDQPSIPFIVIAFIAALGPLVFFHELGHYGVARLFGVKSDTFSIGFGREITGWTDRRGTRWKVGWLPLGGYVRFAGDADEASRPDFADHDPDHFHNRPVWQRFLIVLAGPMANFLLAILIFAAFFMIVGAPRTPTEVVSLQEDSAAVAIGIREGDRLVSIAGRPTDSFEDVRRTVSLRPDMVVDIELVRDGEPMTLSGRLGALEQEDEFGQPYRIGLLGVGSGPPRLTRLSPIAAVPAATGYTWAMTRAILDGVWQIVTGKRSTKDLGGPMKMAQIAGQQASLGIFPFIQLLALFSINLGFINLLPVPMLDGGHLLFYSVEAVRRRPLGERAQEWAFRGGLALLLALILFTTINDLASFGLVERLSRLIG
nr:M50 family metallopeptidase [Sphingomicrobium nitratireducens]